MSALPSLRQIEADLQALVKRRLENKLLHYRPYAKQREFHAAGLKHRERAFLAGNQLGKTVAGSYEVAMHLTGRYPDWWEGKRWNRPIVCWAAGVTGETTRDNPQRLLMGRPGSIGTGAIPAEDILDTSSARGGVADLFDTIQIKHLAGGYSTLALKFYEKGREKWQGETVDLVWFDEEPPQEIYSEGLTRTNATKGITMLTATPLLGMTKVMDHFYPMPDTDDRHLTMMTIDDAEHYTPQERQKIIDAYEEHEREARAKGIPMRGEGLIFPVPEDTIKVPAFKIPAHWVHLGGLDFGWDHPFAATHIAWDRDADVIYVADAYRARKTPISVHASTMKRWSPDLHWAWPADGEQPGDRQSGKAMWKMYAEEGLKMLPEPAAYEDERGNSVEAGVAEMRNRMLSGRFKVFAHLEEYFQELRGYHRKEGKIVKEKDDLISASRYALMMIRHARQLVGDTWNKPISMNTKWVV